MLAITAYLPDNMTAPDLLHAVLAQRQIPPDPAEHPELVRQRLQQCENSQDAYSLLATTIACDQHAICLASVTTNGRLMTAALTTTNNTATSETARLLAQRAAQRLSASPRRSRPQPAQPYAFAIHKPQLWAINEIVRAGERRFAREYGDFPPHVQDTPSLHDPADAIAVAIGPQSLTVSFLRPDNTVDVMTYGATAPDHSNYALDLARDAA